ncbi:MAG: type II CAAX endopeptidase family protein, partial [Chthoniobacteraceae bacterium]
MIDDSLPPSPEDLPAVPSEPPPVGSGEALVSSPFGDLQPPPIPAPRPPLWPALVIGPLAIVAATILAGIFTVIAIAISGGMKEIVGGGDITAEINAAATKLFATPLGALLLILPGQLVFLGGAIAATMLSPVTWKQRLGFTRSRLPIWSWPILAIGTFFIATIAGFAVERMFPDNLEQLEFFNEIARAGGPGIAIFNTLMLSVLPGFGEETMFRGYIQTRLLQRWAAPAAIGVTSVIFAIAHFDPVHMLAVLPIGFWLGTIAWRANSVFPGMVCHAVMNGVSLIGVRLSAGSDDREFGMDTEAKFEYDRLFR